jgi:hypothetical protein
MRSGDNRVFAEIYGEMKESGQSGGMADALDSKYCSRKFAKFQ